MQGVIAPAAFQTVVARAAGQNVVATSAAQVVIIRSATQQIIVARAPELNGVRGIVARGEVERRSITLGDAFVGIAVEIDERAINDFDMVACRDVEMFRRRDDDGVAVEAHEPGICHVDLHPCAGLSIEQRS